MGWHADNEPIYGPEPTIASVTVGAERDFDLREGVREALKLCLCIVVKISRWRWRWQADPSSVWLRC